jgi:uncharacterized DUF497 family protein
MVEFEWDEAKNRTNIAKHGISFELARQIFDGVVWSRIDQRLDYGETRIIAIGVVEQAAILVVAHTERRGRIRIISARRANRRERKRYHDEIYKALGRA